MIHADRSRTPKPEIFSDPNLEAVAKCLTPQLQRLRELINFSDLWRLNDNSNNPPDPSGLVWSISGNTITYDIDVGSFSINGIR